MTHWANHRIRLHQNKMCTAIFSHHRKQVYLWQHRLPPLIVDFNIIWGQQVTVGEKRNKRRFLFVQSWRMWCSDSKNKQEPVCVSASTDSRCGFEPAVSSAVVGVKTRTLIITVLGLARTNTPMASQKCNRHVKCCLSPIRLWCIHLWGQFIVTARGCPKNRFGRFHNGNYLSLIIWATAHTSGTKHPIKADVINDCFLDPSFTLNTTVLLAVPVSESASNTQCMHSICELIADFKKKEISATMALFFWVTLRIKTILSMHVWRCRSTIKKRQEGDDGFCLVTPAVWHFWVIHGCVQEVHYEGRVEAWAMSVRDSWVRGYL